MTWILILHVGIALAAALTGRRLGRRVLLVGAIAPLGSLIYASAHVSDVLEGFVTTETSSWVPAIGLDLVFRLDGFSLLMAMLIGLIGVLVFTYGWRYFEVREDLGRFTALLVVFAGSMLGLVVADNLLLLFVFWELTSITSYLLIGFSDRTAAARSAALQALLVTGAGGLALLGGLVVLAEAAGTYSLSGLLADPPSGADASIGLVLVLLGVFTKSAQVPFHFWLPGAMAAPTPVSAYLHSATMVKAGIYLLARLAPVFAPLIGWWRPVVIGVGVVTMIVGGWRALGRNDLKLLLADGTVSQLGFITILVGAGVPELSFAGMAMILAHAVFKSSLFMVVGIVDHQAHSRDMRRLTEVGRRLRATLLVAIAGLASMAGVPPLLGFVSKESALEGLVHVADPWVVAGVAVGSMLTVAYGLTFLVGGFGTKEPGQVSEPAAPEGRPSGWFLAPPAILAVASVVFGLAPGLVDPLVKGASGAVDAAAANEYLALWHGFGIPIAISIGALAAGTLLWRRPLPRLRDLTSRAVGADSVYDLALRALNRVADRTTSTLQNGSLPVYLGVILVAVILGPGILLVFNWTAPEGLVLAESGFQVAASALVIAAAWGLTRMRRRLGAVLLLGAVGYGVAVLFVIQGAPDLALTQMLVETLTLALFVVVLYHLPERFDVKEWRFRGAARNIVAGLVGLFAAAFTLWASTSRSEAPVTEEYLARALPDAGGRNVVNVILTDFRALDTLGEITVLAVAAMGVVMLVRAARKDTPTGEESG